LERIPVTTMAVFTVLVAGVASLVSPARESGTTVATLPLNGLAAAVGLALAGLLLASAAATTTRRYLPMLAVSGLLACAGILSSGSVARAAFLEAGSLFAVLAVWRSSKTLLARHGYLA